MIYKIFTFWVLEWNSSIARNYGVAAGAATVTAQPRAIILLVLDGFV